MPPFIPPNQQVIEADIPFLDPSVITAYLQQRLPDPVADETAWLAE